MFRTLSGRGVSVTRLSPPESHLTMQGGRLADHPAVPSTKSAKWGGLEPRRSPVGRCGPGMSTSCHRQALVQCTMGGGHRVGERTQPGERTWAPPRKVARSGRTHPSFGEVWERGAPPRESDGRGRLPFRDGSRGRRGRESSTGWPYESARPGPTVAAPAQEGAGSTSVIADRAAVSVSQRVAGRIAYRLTGDLLPATGPIRVHPAVSWGSPVSTAHRPLSAMDCMWYI